MLAAVGVGVLGLCAIVAMLWWYFERAARKGLYVPRATANRTPPAVRRARAPQRHAMAAHRRGRKAFRR